MINFKYKVHKKNIIASGILLSFVLVSFSPFTTFAKPSFSRTQQEWDKLRDNTLEFQEIEALIEEYNPTFKANEREFIKAKNKNSSSNSKIRENYRQAAEEIRGSIVEADIESPNYVSTIVANAAAKAQIENLLKMADSSLDDDIILHLNNERAKHSLVWNAKNNMIAYYNDKINLEKSKLKEELASLDLDIKEKKLKLGTASKVDILNAKDNLIRERQNKEGLDIKKEQNLKKLQTMLGWKYESEPEIGELPSLDLEKINSYNKDEDIKKAIENNFNLKINKRKLGNALSLEENEKLQKEKETYKVDILSLINEAFNNLKNAKSNYEAALSNLEVQKLNLEKINLSNKLSLASEYELKLADYNYKLADLDFENAKNSVLLADLAYQYNILGLASIGEK